LLLLLLLLLRSVGGLSRKFCAAAVDRRLDHVEDLAEDGLAGAGIGNIERSGVMSGFQPR
jgi:hypothetical protein